MAPKTAPKFPPRAHTGKLGGIQKQVWETAAEARANEASEAQAMPEEETAAARAENERARAAEVAPAVHEQRDAALDNLSKADAAAALPLDEPSVPTATPLSVYKYVGETWGIKAHRDNSKIEWYEVVRNVPGLWSQKEAQTLYYRHVAGNDLYPVYHPPSWLVVDSDSDDSGPPIVANTGKSGRKQKQDLGDAPSDEPIDTVLSKTVYTYVGDTWGIEAHYDTSKIFWSQVVSDIPGVLTEKDAKTLYYRHVPDKPIATPLSVYTYVGDTWGMEAHNYPSQIFWSQVVRDVPGVFTQKDAKTLYYRHVQDNAIEIVQQFRARGRVSGGVYHPPSWLNI